jgi:hypothetical protein
VTTVDAAGIAQPDQAADVRPPDAALAVDAAVQARPVEPRRRIPDEERTRAELAEKYVVDEQKIALTSELPTARRRRYFFVAEHTRGTDLDVGTVAELANDLAKTIPGVVGARTVFIEFSRVTRHSTLTMSPLEVLVEVSPSVDGRCRVVLDIDYGVVSMYLDANVRTCERVAVKPSGCTATDVFVRSEEKSIGGTTNMSAKVMTYEHDYWVASGVSRDILRGCR